MGSTAKKKKGTWPKAYSVAVEFLINVSSLNAAIYFYMWLPMVTCSLFTSVGGFHGLRGRREELGFLLN